jgi:hypothetical protein
MGRAYRIVRELHHPVPYVVQGKTDQVGYWVDVMRFGRPDEARDYVIEVLTRARILEEGLR